eukprot:TRINITY_DN1805_c0_g3_i1.p1 TRINITY_DN1805_c0_g3~~TRINITY_DN1805_c0_g3_i1.p1  ORF type:complete len:495 (+),score=129.41 TRINITY_DN1805_c0_g3_i1:41-1486(+)
MDEEGLKLATGVISDVYLKNSRSALQRVESTVHSLLAQRKIPEEGLRDEFIEHLLHHIALMDSNNYMGNVGVGEREGRVHSSLVKRRHYGMSHGIGRSGDLTANQPKAAGSSLIYSLCNMLVADALRMAGAKRTTNAIVVPMATGMALTLVLQSLQSRKETPSGDAKEGVVKKRWIIWSRIDQKTCLKCIYTAGYEAKVVPLVREGDFFITNVKGIEEAIEECGADNVCCVLSTTSCFAPRLPDKILDIARLCKKHGMAHVVNNAYGVQSTKIMRQLDAAMEHGRVDAYVQSGDKNFMVPVGGSVVATNNADFLKRVGAIYAGRASCSSVLDIFITLLSMGRSGFMGLLKERTDTLSYFHEAMKSFADSKGERLVASPANDISFCLTINSIKGTPALGSALFNHCVSGPRVVQVGTKKEICGLAFNNYGSHSDETDYSYLTLACAIGIKRDDIDTFMKRLDKEWTKMVKKEKKQASKDVPQ